MKDLIDDPIDRFLTRWLDLLINSQIMVVYIGVIVVGIGLIIVFFSIGLISLGEIFWGGL